MLFGARTPLSNEERKAKQLERILGRAQLASLNVHTAGSGGATLLGVSLGLAISVEESDSMGLDYVMVLGLAVGVLMWLSHGSALRQEDLFKKLHEQVQSLPPEKVDESMDTTSLAVGMPSRLEYCRRRGPAILHGSATIAIIGSWCYLKLFAL